MSVGDPSIHGAPAPIYLQTATSPSRLERVAEALFVQAMAEWTKGVPNWQTSVKDVAATAIRQAVAFEKVWELRES